jgi:hypothetical protein
LTGPLTGAKDAEPVSEAPAASPAPVPAATATASCRSCGSDGLILVIDLGSQPPAEQFVEESDLAEPDLRLPLRILVCSTCWLVQLDGDPLPADDEPGGIAFSSSTMRQHMQRFAQDALGHAGPPPSTIFETASHGNRLAEAFRSLGAETTLLEPAPGFARAAREAGVPTVEARLDEATADRLIASGSRADLFVDAFYLAHDARPTEYLAGVKRLLAPGGVAAFEFDHVLPVILDRQYDGFRHGHASYLSLSAFARMLERVGLEPVDAVQTTAYGGSLRVFVTHADAARDVPEAVARILSVEAQAGLNALATYQAFAARVEQARLSLRTFLDDRRRDGSVVAGYGAPSRGNTLLNSSGVGVDDVAFVVDRAPSKQGRYLPGSRIPIYAPERIDDVRPDYLLILTWDLVDEVTAQMSHVRTWGGRFVVPVPTVTVLD